MQLERTVGELKRSNANLEEFAYAASHDLKEPIRKIHFFNDRLKSVLKNRLGEEETKSLERMEMAAKRMSSLIDDLLSYSQVGLRPRTYEEVNLNQIIDLVLDDLDLEIEEKGANISVSKLFTIQGHHRQLQQAFQNLIGNALKYGKPGIVPQIKITGEKVKGKDQDFTSQSPQKHFYLVNVSDNGIGFEQTDAERIFNVFTRLHGNSDYRGTGVGLSIVRKVIENHDGLITAESEPGKGATFKIYLPID
jgi:light-regulated signal transduction histidine kinase (bacteriophytochrome)